MNRHGDFVALPNGPAAAAILAAGSGCFSLGVFAVLADHATWFGRRMIFYRPTGPLSGVTTCAVVVWLLAWIILELRWQKKTVRTRPVVVAALVLLALGLLLTFPPVSDLF
jgi:hypothetical protein